MTRTTWSTAVLFAITTFVSAQQSSSYPDSLQHMQAPTADREVAAVLSKYESAYQHMSLYELQSVWPDLPNQKKEYRRDEELFRSGDVSQLQVSVQIQDIRWLNDFAIVRCIRHERFLKTYHSTYTTGDPHSAPGFGTVDQPHTQKVKKDQEFEFSLQRSSTGNWIIASIRETGKVKAH